MSWPDANTRQTMVSEEDDKGVISDLAPISPVLLIAFGGQAMRFAGEPPFEFFRTLNEYPPTKRIFIRDHHRCWYHKGVHGLASDIRGVATELKRMIAAAGAKKVVMLGTSGGGYAALLFGRLAGATEVHAFGAQTFLSPHLRRRYGDNRFKKGLLPLLSSGCYRNEYGDLDGLFNRTPTSDTKFVLHYCERDRLDAIHARHLLSQQGVELRRYAEGGHNVARHLLDRGEFAPIMRQILSYDASGDASKSAFKAESQC